MRYFPMTTQDQTSFLFKNLNREVAAPGSSRLTLHVVNGGSIPVGSSHGKVRLLIHPGAVLKSGPKARRILRSDLTLKGMAGQSTEFYGLMQR